MYHVPQFLEKCGSLSNLNCQPVEKKNHEQSRIIHRGTQKVGRQTRYTVQVMEKEDRQLFARVKHLQLTRRSYTRKCDGDTGTIATYNNNQEEGQL